VEKVRDGGRVVRKCLVLAYGVHESGYREVIALDVGEAETEAFWRSFLRGLVERGLTGVQLVVSDAHAGLKKAIAQVLGCPWQRCSVHFLRAALGHVRKDQQGMVAALLRTAVTGSTGNVLWYAWTTRLGTTSRRFIVGSKAPGSNIPAVK